MQIFGASKKFMVIEEKNEFNSSTLIIAYLIYEWPNISHSSCANCFDDSYSKQQISDLCLFASNQHNIAKNCHENNDQTVKRVALLVVPLCTLIWRTVYLLLCCWCDRYTSSVLAPVACGRTFLQSRFK